MPYATGAPPYFRTALTDSNCSWVFTIWVAVLDGDVINSTIAIVVDAVTNLYGRRLKRNTGPLTILTNFVGNLTRSAKLICAVICWMGYVQHQSVVY
jgi:hypothetical protein